MVIEGSHAFSNQQANPGRLTLGLSQCTVLPLPVGRGTEVTQQLPFLQESLTVQKQSWFSEADQAWVWMFGGLEAGNERVFAMTERRLDRDMWALLKRRISKYLIFQEVQGETDFLIVKMVCLFMLKMKDYSMYPNIFIYLELSRNYDCSESDRFGGGILKCLHFFFSFNVVFSTFEPTILLYFCLFCVSS